VFVNNTSLGVYAAVIRSPQYRDAKLRTAAAALPGLFGPDAEPLDLRFRGPDEATYPSAHLILVSNNPYQLVHPGGWGSRARLDSGALGIVAVRITEAADARRFLALEMAGQVRRFPGWLEWSAPRFEVASGGPVQLAVDGEALELAPPLIFRSWPGALRVWRPRPGKRCTCCPGPPSPTWRGWPSAGKQPAADTELMVRTRPRPAIIGGRDDTTRGRNGPAGKAEPMSTGPEQPQGPQWNPQAPAGGYGQGGWPGQGAGQAQDQQAWQSQPQPQPQQPWSPAQPGYPPAVMPKNPAVGLLVSFFIPGLGSIISGNTNTGVIILVVWIVGLILFWFLIGIPVVIGAWIWGMVDGYKSAQDWNRAHGILS
jgi:TM2 domain-containing membrane protein YozV